MSEEIWKDIPEYEGLYEASSHGRVRSKKGRVTYRTDFSTGEELPIVWKSNKILKPKLVEGSELHYYQVNLYKDKVQRTLYVHRIVAETFISNPNMYPEVNHIDGNKLNNKVNNLEWVTAKQNMGHAVKNGLFKNATQIELVPLDGGESLFFNTMGEGNRYLGRNNSYLFSRINDHDFHIAKSRLDKKEYIIKFKKSEENV